MIIASTLWGPMVVDGSVIDVGATTLISTITSRSLVCTYFTADPNAGAHTGTSSNKRPF